jgi:hypothetical protein
MDVTVYLPDEIGAWAKENEVNLSGTLREAIMAMRIREETLKDSDEIHLNLVSEEGRSFVGRFTGKLLVSTEQVDVYLTQDERIFVHTGDTVIEVLEDDLEKWVKGEDYLEACMQLGVEPIVDL